MKERKVREIYLPYLHKEFLEKKINFIINYESFMINNESFVNVSTDLNSKDFHEILEDAMCEYESINLQNGTPVIPFRKLIIMDENIPDCFSILSKDQERFSKLIEV